jgi:hypothetical protein
MSGSAPLYLDGPRQTVTRYLRVNARPARLKLACGARRHFLVLKCLIAVRAAKVAGLGGQYDEIEIVRAKMSPCCDRH